MHDSFENFIIQKAETITLPQVKRFYRDNQMRPQAAKLDEVYVLKNKHKILAALRLCPIGDDWLLRSMCVEESFRGQKIGTYFLAQLQDVLLEKSCYSFPYIHLQMFYAKAGFSVCDDESVPVLIQQRYDTYVEKGKKIILMRYLAKM